MTRPNALTEKEKEEALEIFTKIFRKWNASLSESYKNIQELLKKNPKPSHEELREAVAPTADCYASWAVLDPTKSDKICETREDIQDYFAHFAAMNPVGEIQRETLRVLHFSHKEKEAPSIMVRGSYVFTMDDANARRVDLACRFTYALEKEDGEWKWAYHSSNVLPSWMHPQPIPSYCQNTHDRSGINRINQGMHT